MKIGHALLLALLIALIWLGPWMSLAQAQEPVCIDVWVAEPPPFGSIQRVCSCEGGAEQPPEGCTPGMTMWITEYVQDPLHPESCFVTFRLVDICTGQVLQEGYTAYDACPGLADGGEHPCEQFIVTGSGITCQTEWELAATVSFPETFLDTRPYPVTLVRWPTALRNGGLPPASGSGTLDYIGFGGGHETDPEVDDWRDVRLTLTLNPAGYLWVSLPNIGTLALPPVDESTPPFTFQWELPSHPDAGGNPLAGSISGLEMLPTDLPLFAGSARSPYRLFWSLAYQEYDRDCKAGPNDRGNFECKTKGALDFPDGHWEYEWENRHQDGEILPTQVAGLPEQLAADLNNDGIPEAYWNYNLTIRRMDENNQVDGPWAAAWNWGGAVYWAVREGQGQIGWP